MYGSYGWAAVKYHSDHFMDLANSIKLPEWFIPEQKDMEQVCVLFSSPISGSIDFFLSFNLLYNDIYF